jgi:hypothetical protein
VWQKKYFMKYATNYPTGHAFSKRDDFYKLTIQQGRRISNVAWKLFALPTICPLCGHIVYFVASEEV